jgi:parvulin-like peptidyl-prolyl isomerase
MSSRRKRSRPLAALLAAAACAAPNPARPSEPAPWSPPTRTAAAEAQADPSAAAQPADAAQDPAAPEAGAGRLTIATVAGQAIDVTELLAQWLHRASPDVMGELDQLVVGRMVQLEVARLGIEVEAEDVESAYQNAVAAIEREIRRSRPNVTLDEFVERVLDLDAETYRKRLRLGALHARLAERVFRSYYLTSDHAMARMMVVSSEEAASEVQKRLAAGEPFEALARELSIEDDEEQRGRAVPVVKSDTMMSRLVFQTPAGEVAGPSREQGAFIFVQVLERAPPLAGRWPDLKQAVETSLAERRMEDLEVEQWRAAMLRRYDVDLSPFLRLAGEPVGQGPGKPGY